MKPTKKSKAAVPDIARPREFVSFVGNLEAHQFFAHVRRVKGFNMTIVADNEAPFRYNFDPFHLECFLLRWRQITERSELFYFASIRASLLELCSENNEFHYFYSDLVEFIEIPVETGSIIRPNGKHLTKVYSVRKTPGAHLYLDRAHSERRFISKPNSVYDEIDSEWMDALLVHSCATLGLRLGMMALNYRSQINRMAGELL